MSKKMLINATLPEENRVAIVDDGILSELDIEVAGREQTKGNIYKAVVVRVETGLQAAFVDYGAERLGFLQIDEVNFKTVKPDLKLPEGQGRPRITDLLHRGQELLVQIVKEERGTKGAALTTYVSLAGRYMVLMPDSNTRGVSRKAETDSQRKQLKKAMASLELPEQFGYIVRTAALDQTREELERDSRYLMRLYESITSLQKSSKAPALIYRESNLVIRSIRDYFTTDMDEVLIDDQTVFQEAKDFFKMVMPDHVGLVKQHQERRPIFSRYQIEDQIETLNSNKVNLPSGGSIVIDPTEALVAIDINSGKMSSEKGVEGTATKSNLEAAAEIGRQLRLRDLGGLIVIDFIDMRDRKNIRAVEKQLKESTALDKARINIGRISQFGLLEMSRQRIKATLAEGTYQTCPHCQGMGRIKSPESLAVNLLRRIHTGVAKGQIGKVEAELPLDVASYLLNNKREELHELERRYRLQIHIHGRTDFLTEQVELDFQKREKELEPANGGVTVGMLQSLVEETASNEEKPKTAAVADVENEGEAPPAKKRRRRRGRRRSSDIPPADQSTVSAETIEETTVQTDETATQPAEQTTSALPVSTTEPDAATSEAEENPATKRPRRRRSSRSKAKVDESATETVSQAGGDQPEAVAAPQTKLEETPVDTSDTVEKKPRRRKTPRTRPAPEAPPQSDGTQKTELQAAAESSELSPPEVKPEVPEKKPAAKRSRSRRPAKKTEETSPITEAGVSTQPQPAATNEVKADNEAAKAKPKPRRTTRTKPQKVDADTGDAGAKVVEAPATTSPQEETKEETPKRKRARTPLSRTRKVEESAETTTAVEPPVVADEKLKRKPAPRRTTTKKTNTDTPAGQEAVSESAPDTAEAKPKSRRTPRKQETVSDES